MSLLLLIFVTLSTVALFMARSALSQIRELRRRADTAESELLRLHRETEAAKAFVRSALEHSVPEDPVPEDRAPEEPAAQPDGGAPPPRDGDVAVAARSALERQPSTQKPSEPLAARTRVIEEQASEPRPTAEAPKTKVLPEQQLDRPAPPTGVEAPVSPPVNVQPLPYDQRPSASVESDWERWLGVRGAAIAGAVVLALAAILFFRHAIEAGWIGPLARVLFGYASGFGLLIGSERLRGGGFLPVSNGLAGTGIVTLYASTWAAHALYGFIPLLVAYPLMLLITVGCGVLAWRNDSAVTAMIGLLGGFVTPLLLAGTLDHPIGLFGYLLILNGGLWLLGRHRHWTGLATLGQALTFLYQFGWIAARLDSSSFWIGLLILAVFAAAYLVVGQKWRIESDGDQAREGALQQVLGIAAPFALTFWLTVHAELAMHALPLALFVLALNLVAIWLAGALRLQGAAVALAACDLALMVAWSGQHMNTSVETWAVTAFGLLVSLLFHFSVERYAVAPVSDQDTASRDDRERAFSVALLPSGLLWFGLLLWYAVLAVFESSFTYWPWLLAASVSTVGLLRLSGLAAEWARSGARNLLAVMASSGISLGLGGWILAGPSAANLSYEVLLGSAVIVGAALLGWAYFRQSLLADGARTVGVPAGWAWKAVAISPVVSLAALAITSGHVTALVMYSFAGALAMLIVLAASAGASGRLYALAALLLLGVHFLWTFQLAEGERATTALVAQLLSVVVFTAWPFLGFREARSMTGASSRSAWMTSALAGPLWFFPLRYLWLQGFGDSAIGLLPVLLGLVAGAAAWTAWQVKGEDSDSACEHVATYSTVALVFAAVAVPMQLEREWITMGWSLEALAAFVLWQRFSHRGLRFFGLVLHGAVLARLLLNPSLLSYHAGDEVLPILNWLAYTYLVPAVSLVMSARILRSGDHQGAESESQVLGGSAVLLGFAWVNLTILELFSEGGVIQLPHSQFAERDLTLSLAWAIYAMLLLGYGMWRKERGPRWASLCLLMVALIKTSLYDLGELEDLYRVASLVGLAVSLIGVSLLYQRFVFRDEDDETMAETPRPPAP